MAFKLYTGERGTSDVEEVSITSNGVIALSPALSEGQFKNVGWVQIFVDRDSKQIGIKPAKEDADHAYKLIRPSGSKRSMLSGSGLLKSQKVFVDGTGKIKPTKNIPARFDSRIGMLIFKAS